MRVQGSGFKGWGSSHGGCVDMKLRPVEVDPRAWCMRSEGVFIISFILSQFMRIFFGKVRKNLKEFHLAGPFERACQRPGPRDLTAYRGQYRRRKWSILQA